MLTSHSQRFPINWPGARIWTTRIFFFFLSRVPPSLPSVAKIEVAQGLRFGKQNDGSGESCNLGKTGRHSYNTEKILPLQN